MLAERPVRDKSMLFYVRMHMSAHLWPREPVKGKDKDRAAASGLVCVRKHSLRLRWLERGPLGLHSWKQNDLDSGTFGPRGAQKLVTLIFLAEGPRGLQPIREDRV